MSLANFRVGQTIQGQGNWDTNEDLRALGSMVGQKLGDWQTDPRNNWRYIDSQWGKLYDIASTQGGNDPTNEANSPGGQFRSGSTAAFGRYGNEHGSDQLLVDIGEDGVLSRVRTNNESNREMNTMLALMATLGTAAYLAPAAGAASAGGAVATPVAAPGAIASAPGLGGVAGATSSGVLGTGLSALEIAQLGLAAGGLFAGGAGRGGDSSAGPIDEPVLAAPTAPPGAVQLDPNILGQEFYRQNATSTRNQTLLTDPSKVRSHLIASGNTLLGA